MQKVVLSCYEEYDNEFRASMQRDSWPEVTQRLFSIASIGSLAGLSHDHSMSGGVDIGLGDYVGSSPISHLGPSIVTQGLLASALPPNPFATSAAVPLVRFSVAFNLNLLP